MIRRPPRSTLFPYPPLFRSGTSANPTAYPDWPLPASQNVKLDLTAATNGMNGALGFTESPAGTTETIVDDASKALATLRSEEHTSELQSRQYLVCRLLLEKK